MRLAISPPRGLVAGAAFVLVLAAASAAAADTNVIANWTLLTTNGVTGVLRAGSPWGPGSTPSSFTAAVDGVFQPENQQWNNGSLWWDQDPSVNTSQVDQIVQLDQLYTVDHFTMQADDNDSYRVEWWDGSAFQLAWNVAAVNTFGLVTRTSGPMEPITTDRFRLTAVGGDNYFAISEFQAFAVGVPEPSTWALTIAGFALAGATLRRRRSLTQLA